MLTRANATNLVKVLEKIILMMFNNQMLEKCQEFKEHEFGRTVSFWEVLDGDIYEAEKSEQSYLYFIIESLGDRISRT